VAAHVKAQVGTSNEHQQVQKSGEVAPTMYLGMDGTGVPMRTQEVADRAGKQADGSAKTREASWSPSGPQNRVIRKAGRCAIRDR
jgi:hypothetical protein